MSDNFTLNSTELIQIYLAVKLLVDENNADLDKMAASDTTREDYVSQNKTCNEILRKVKRSLKQAGINIDELAKEYR